MSTLPAEPDAGDHFTEATAYAMGVPIRASDIEFANDKSREAFERDFGSGGSQLAEALETALADCFVQEGYWDEMAERMVAHPALARWAGARPRMVVDPALPLVINEEGCIARGLSVLAVLLAIALAAGVGT